MVLILLVLHGMKNGAAYGSRKASAFVPEKGLIDFKTVKHRSNDAATDTRKAPYTVSNEPCGVELRPTFRVEHGHAVIGVHQWPFMAYVTIACTVNGHKRTIQYCGGPVVQKRWVVIAAHCADVNVTLFVENKCDETKQLLMKLRVRYKPDEIHEVMQDFVLPAKASEMRVTVGSKDRTFGTVHEVARIKRHEFYRRTSSANDIALLELKDVLEFGPRINRICLPKKEQRTGTTATIIGWGKTKLNNMSADAELIDPKILRQDLVHLSSECPQGFFCQLSAIHKTSHGDSGSPLLRKNGGSCYIASDVVHDIFKWVPIKVLAEKISDANYRFLWLTCARRWHINVLEIRKRKDNNEMEVIDEWGQTLPIADQTVPPNVIGFKRIRISYLNQSAINFVHLFDPLFSRISTCLEISASTEETSAFISQQLMPILKERVFAMNFWESNDFSLLRQFEPDILIHCPLLLYIQFNNIIFFNYPGQTIETALDSEAVANWLIMPRERGATPKLLQCSFTNEMQLEEPIMAARETFTGATSAAPFIIAIYFLIDNENDKQNQIQITPFNITNQQTNEQMMCRQREDGFWMLIRSPTGKNKEDEEKWKIWETHATHEQFLDNLWNTIEINCNEIVSDPTKPGTSGGESDPTIPGTSGQFQQTRGTKRKADQ
ncbi:hypothetical protein niasHS_014430 [Heterodera schachtii]|uniref:Peptidase S1 domain-containing protein n=1 Tax=Heterodera schachtii TaxID=97005 RepID=A0ABD2ICN6_HETSC